MSEKAIDWKLEELYPEPTHTFFTTRAWLDQQFLRRFYSGRSSGTRYHPGQLDRFTRMDRRAGTRWRARYAKTLFAVRRAVVDYVQKHHSQDYDLWMLRNCQPAGARWKGSHYYNSPTGKRCQHPLCPWCYLRRFHDYRKLVLAPTGEDVKLIHRRGVKKGLGFGDKVNLTLVEARGDDSLLTLFSQAEFRRRAHDAMRRPFVQRDSVIRSKSPEFEAGLRLFSIDHDDGQFVLRMGHIHVNALESPRLLMGKTLGLCRDFSITRHGDLHADEALRLAMPFPIRLLSGVVEGRAVVKALRGRKTWGVVHFKDPARSQAQAPQQCQQPASNDQHEADCLSICKSAT
jgi:hypothetical protein